MRLVRYTIWTKILLLKNVSFNFYWKKSRCISKTNFDPQLLSSFVPKVGLILFLRSLPKTLLNYLKS